MRNINLHSTLFILIPMYAISFAALAEYLHSTLFILIRMEYEGHLYTQAYLHSTLFILIPAALQVLKGEETESTFHFVYINTQKLLSDSFCRHNLHSTLFILILFLGESKDTDYTYLHSTLFILIHHSRIYRIQAFLIYIPLCLY